MKVLQINVVYKYGSTGRIAKELHEFLLSQNIESHIATSDRRIDVDGVMRIGTLLDHKLHALYSRIFGLQGYFSHIATLRFIRKIKRINPDVVHLHNLHGNFINIPLLLKYLAKNEITTVVTLHDCWFFTGHCCYYTDHECKKWSGEGCHHCPAIGEYNKSWFFDFSSKIFRDKALLFQKIERLAVIGVSDWMTNQARQSLLKSAKIIKRVYNWIDLGVFYPRNRMVARTRIGVGESDFVILGLSQSWSRAKGIDIFIEIAKRVPNHKIVLVGSYSGTKNYPSNVLMIGEIESLDELAELYSMADIFVNPSVQESFGKVTAEALACGVPIVANNTTATPELLGEGCGYLVNNNSIEEYIDHIDTIYRDTKESYSERCVQFAHNFTKERLLDEHLDLYNAVLRESVSLCKKR